MKKFTLVLLILITFSGFAQEKVIQNATDTLRAELIKTDGEKEVKGDTYNRWSIELDLGMSKGSKPYNSSGKYYASDPSKFLGGFQLNHYGIGGRYMLSPKFGVKSHLSYDDIKNLSGSESLPFKVESIELTFEGVVNLIRLFDFQEESKRFGLLFHFGGQVSQISPKMGPTAGHKELNGGILVGFTPAVRIFDNVSVFLDVVINSNIRQHFNWDGSYADLSNNLTGSMFTTALGLSYSFGTQKIHGDWALIRDAKSKEIDELNNRIGEIETLMNDTDKDGVPDYLDVENNSIAGVSVDTKGRMVDKNGNGVPDDLEKYVDSAIANQTILNNNNNKQLTEDIIIKLINEGYIVAYFDSTKAQPNNESADNIGFILNYLKKNPNKSINIMGYADEIGDTEFNKTLSLDRALNVKTILIKAGISPNRLNVVGSGIDKSVDKDSEYTRRLVRKVTFKVK